MSLFWEVLEFASLAVLGCLALAFVFTKADRF